MKSKLEKSSTRSGVQSVEIGMKVLKALAAIGDCTSLNELAEATDMHPAKAHRYLVSLIQSGFVERTDHGRYQLGPYMLELSTSYLSRLDPNTVANTIIEKMRTKTDEGLILTVWGDSGVTVIRWFQARHPISVSIRPGAIFSTLMSASGRIFLAHLPEALTHDIVQRELNDAADDSDPRAIKSWQEVETIVEDTRSQGLALVTGHSVEWVSALAAPIFDYRGELVLSLALFGFKSNFDVSLDSQKARLLKDTAEEISKQLGYKPETD